MKTKLAQRLPTVVALLTPTVTLALLLMATSAPAQGPVLVASANTTVGERQLAVGAAQKPMAITRNGNVYLLSRFRTATQVDQLGLYRSTDGGASFHVETQVRTPSSSAGSVVVGPDGLTLHLAWEEVRAPLGNSVVYGRYDTVSRTWVGTDVVLFQGGANQDNGYLMPDLDVDPSGNPVVAITTHRAQSWSAWMRYFDGSVWTAAQRVNVDTFGFAVNVAVDRQGDFHFVYRTNTGLYGIRYRRFDVAAAAFGSEGEIQVEAGTSNITSFGVDSAGAKYVLLAKTGSLELAVAGPSSFTFTLHQVAVDTGLTMGNTSYANYALCLAGDLPWVFYSNRGNGMNQVFMRVFAGGMLLPEIPYFLQSGRSYERIAAHRSSQRTMAPSVALISVDAATGREDLMAGTLGAGFVPFGLGCAGSGGFVPYAGARGVPSLGSSNFMVTLERARGGSPVAFLLGTSDQSHGALPLPLDLGLLGMPGCRLYNNIALSLNLMASGTGAGDGTASVPLLVPNDPTLQNARLFGQWVIVDGVANPLGLSASGSGAVVLR